MEIHLEKTQVQRYAACKELVIQFSELCSIPLLRILLLIKTRTKPVFLDGQCPLKYDWGISE